MEKRNIQIDLDTARKWYKGDDKSLKILAKQAFTIEELEEHELPKSWEEFGENGYLSSRYFKYTNKIDTLEKLLILRDVYRQGWKPNWEDNKQNKYCIDKNTINDYIYTIGHTIPRIFSFPTIELAKKFLENFRKELEQLKELL